MLRLIPILLLAANPPTVHRHRDPEVSQGRGDPVGRVDRAWLERALRRDPEADAKALVAEFAKAHPSKALPRGTVVDEGAYLRLLTANLDEDPEPEHLLVIGPTPWHTELYVIDRRGETWAIAFERDFELLNEEPELHVLPDGLFYLRTLRERGSGAWLFTWRFFKLVDDGVVDALEIVQESNLRMEASDLYQHAEATVRPSPSGFSVTYAYRFSPSQQLLTSLGLRKRITAGAAEVPLIAGKEVVEYAWNPVRKALSARFVRGGLDEAKVRCLMELGEEAHVAAAFRWELEKLAKTGNADQRPVAAHLLETASASSPDAWRPESDIVGHRAARARASAASALEECLRSPGCTSGDRSKSVRRAPPRKGVGTDVDDEP